LIFIFGEIVYGGHIVNDIDRILANAYLKNMMVDELFDDLELFPYLDPKMTHLSFKVTAQSSYDKYYEYIEQSLNVETPLAYGLHPNAEIGFRTAQCELLFNTLVEL